MVKYFATFLVIFIMSASVFAQQFAIEQKKNSRVKTAYSEKEAIVKKLLSEQNISDFNIEIYIRIFKKEKIVELWAKPKNVKEFKHITDYQICSTSGQEGPKRSQGDGQTPEGFYYISRYNPYSSYYLSMGINYPNQADLRVIGNANPGGDIFIHGSCVTIGCVPITDEKIKELYLMAVEAKSHGQNKVPVHIFPCKMSDSNMEDLKKADASLYSFWQSLKIAWDHFENKKTIPSFTVDKSGKYIVTP
jgi:murein L,D-transpeptidase YafK